MKPDGLFHRTHRREQYNVADGVAVSKQHHHTVNPDTETRRRRQAVLQRGDVVFVVEHRFVIARVFRGNLILEALRLIFRVVQLAKAVADFAATNEEFKRSVISGFSSLRRASGETSAGYSVMKVG